MLKETLRQYAVAGLIAAILIASYVGYLLATGRSLELRTFNNAIANSSVVLLAITLSLGPLARLFDVFDRYLTYRKETGIWAFLLGLTHVYLAMGPLARSGPFGFYQSRPLSAYAGLVGLVIMFGLFTISLEAIKQKLGTSLWWKLQFRGARLAGLAILIHFGVLRWSAWGEWLKAGGLPPASLITATIALAVILLRLVDWSASFKKSHPQTSSTTEMKPSISPPVTSTPKT
ncbi:MAG: ferric reductase-like transmembrane domain-containing protein [Candidatus Chisholmbacteria bacterium]|nr:ferric reductase-like transmembrane domain-containing protein [Candidatus Chisholmbacteria bacterium]